VNEPVRLAKRLAEQLGCSRREAEQYIEGGWVRVDGAVVEEPQFRVRGERVEVAPDASPLALTPVTILLNKPEGMVAEIDSPPGEGDAVRCLTPGNRAPDDRSGIRLIRKHFSNIELVTPLAPRAGGLVVFTQDFRIARKLREDAHLLEHEVIVQVSGAASSGGLERLNRIDHGFTFAGKPLPPVKASWQSENRLRFALKGEQPGQLAYLCESIGLKVEAMKRIRIGRVPMSALPAGQWRYLLADERF
jgi:23S rRNA pseudouridine2604 synthase